MTNPIELKTTKEELARYSKVAKNYRKLKQANLIHDALLAHDLKADLTEANKRIAELKAELIEADKDLCAYALNARRALKYDPKWEGVPEIIDARRDKIRKALKD